MLRYHTVLITNAQSLQHCFRPLEQDKKNDAVPPCVRTLSLIIHPCRGTVTPEPCCKAQTGGAHGKVGDNVPDETNELRNGRDKGQDGAMQLRAEVTRTVGSVQGGTSGTGLAWAWRRGGYTINR